VESELKKAANEFGDAVNELKSEAINVANEVKAELGDVFSAFRDDTDDQARRKRSQNTSQSASQSTSQNTSQSASQSSARQSARASTQYSAQRYKTGGRNKQKNPLSRRGKTISTLLLVLTFPFIIVGAIGIFMSLGNLLSGGNVLSELVFAMFWLAGGVTLLIVRTVLLQRNKRYNKLYNMVSGRDMVLISDLARSAGMSETSLRRDIEAMIDKGLLGDNAYIDHELNCIVISSTAAAAAREASARAGASSPVSPKSESAETQGNQFMSIIVEIRELNLAITDVQISQKVDKIEDLTAKIFKIVEEDPSKRPRIERFISYYIPTTKQFLRSYATLERQGVKGGNIKAAKEKIGVTLDTLAEGFEQQLDQLFEAEVMDIAAEINVLENLMKQDGLSGSDDGIGSV
jgi:DNA-binding Lrp family transcriptional regulator